MYSADSSICRAALHAGVLTNNGGEVMIFKIKIKIMILSASKDYEGKTQHGIKSLAKGSYDRAFKVLGDLSSACRYFEENY